MKKLLFKYAKKSMALFMACLMLMSVWVWVAPTKAEAYSEINSILSADQLKSFSKFLYGDENATLNYIVNTTNGTFGSDSSHDTGKTYHKNVFLSGTAIKQVGIASYTLQDNAIQSADILYPSTVLIYDGSTTPQFGVVHRYDAHNNCEIFHWATEISGANLSFGNSNWRGGTGGTGNGAFMAAMASSNGTCGKTDAGAGVDETSWHSTKDWAEVANVIKYTGNLGNNYATATYNTIISPTFYAHFSQAKNTGCNATGYKGDTTDIKLGTASNSIAVINIVPWKTALEHAANQYKNLLTNGANYYTEASVENFKTYVKALFEAHPSNLVKSVSDASKFGTVNANDDITSNKEAVQNYYASGQLVRGYTVTWKNYDGETLETLETDKRVAPGTTPSYDGAAPSRGEDDQFVYEFNNKWNTMVDGTGSSISAVTGDVTYYAQYKTTTKTYTVTWLDNIGQTAETDKDVPYGTMPSYNGATPTKSYDRGYHYKHNGWNPAVSAVTGNVTYTPTFDPIAHTFDKQVVSDTYKKSDATCTAKAVYYYSCSCGQSSAGLDGERTFEYGEKAPHALQHYDASAAGCTSTGNKEYWQCSTCGDKFNANGNIITDINLPATGHIFGAVVPAKDATCTVDGNRAYKQCTVCNHYFAADAATNATNAATLQSFIIKATGEHSYTYTQNSDNKTHTGTCSVCGGTVTAECSGGTATCTELATCTVCSEAYGDFAPHKSVADNAKDPTCTEDGLTSGSHCSVCGHIIAAQTVIRAEGHKFGATVAEVKATCTTGGRRAYKQCTTCSKYFEADADAFSTDAKAGVAAFDVAMLGHDYSTEYTVDKKASCTTIGSKARCCTRCKTAKIDVTPIYARAHTWEDTTVATPATCTTSGVMNQKCSNEETAEYEACSATRTRVIPADGHTYEVTDYKAPTCTEPGNEAYKYCSVCNLYFDAEADATAANGVASAEGFVIPALNHDFAVDFTVDVKASCVATGSKSKHCRNEGCEEKVEVTVIPLRQHVIVDDDIVTDSTCTETGVMSQKCSNTETAEYEACDYTTTRVIPAKGHSFGEIIPAVPATCEDTGRAAYKYCAACKKYYAADAATDSTDAKDSPDAFITPKLGHDFADEYTTDIYATCKYPGSESRHCSRCDATTDERVIPATGEHVYAVEVPDTRVDPTCTEDGHVRMACGCGLEATEDTVLPKLGHKDEDTDHKCDNGCDVYQGTHADTDLDHICDYGCKEAIGDCEDEDKDHDCDYGCDKYYGVHEDTNLDHICDYGCKETIGDHEDSADDDDHICDYCKDESDVLEGCSDKTGDGDHLCDVCDEAGVTDCTKGEEVRENEIPATCDAEGKYNSVYYCTECGKEVERTDNVAIPKLPHNWGETIYTWAEDGSACTATHTCLDFASHTEEATAVISDEVGTEATCDADGSTKYTATFDKEWAETQEKVIFDIPATGHADADTNHKCDNGCDVFQGEHKDLNLDHKCDYGCLVEDFGEHKDTDNDHKCDYCFKKLDNCVDSPEDPAKKDHKCDICGKVLERCEDKDKDHACDNGCTKEFGTCEDKDKDHKCDYGCDKVYGGECADTDNDHLCDYGCGKTFGDYADENKDHICDCGKCGTVIGECEDKNFDHYCDYGYGSENGCDEYFGECADSDNDHDCDYGCDKVYGGECADVDPYDHKCDYCGDVLTTHIDADRDHKCDDPKCDKPIGEHDEDAHICAYCGAVSGECADENTDHICDLGCGKDDIGAHGDSENDDDHKCDYCGQDEMTDHTPGEMQIENEVPGDCGVAATHDEVYYCTECKAEISRETIVDSTADHDWNEEIKYYWNADGSACSAVRTCKKDATHIERISATVTSVPGEEATCKDMGTTVYTATFAEDWADTQETEIKDIPTIEHKDADFDHKCDYDCGKEDFGTCEDKDLDHDCDYGCDKAYGTHADSATDKDHLCDYGCGVSLGTCVDENNDHVCDYGCEEVQGTHADTNNDHVCDYGCSVAIGECADNDNDHDCDYGCSATFGTCADSAEDADHVCDYGCGAVLEDCEDTDLDHACDNGCDKVYGKHEDTDKDHDCEYGCDDAIGECADNDKNHKCDYGCGKDDFGTCEDKDFDHACDYGCDKSYGTHADSAEDADHVCDYGCGAVLEDCVDAEKNHSCDICEAAMGACEDKNKDHKCDYGCAKEDFGTCEDKDLDHDCDYGCDKAYGTHADSATDKDHVCDYGCGAVLEKCEDADLDHDCDYGCDKVYGACEDKDLDHDCDYGCDKAYGTCEDEDPKDHLCDYGCGKYSGTHADSAEDADHVCDYGCGAVLEDCFDSDTDKDHKCDVCGEDGKSDHKWVNATCAAPKTCSVCDATEGSSVDHNFSKVISTTAGTCIAEGTVVYECTTCPADVEAAKKTVKTGLDKTNHAGTATIIINDKEATCTETGYTGDVYYACCYDENKSVAQNKNAFVSAGSVIKLKDHNLINAAPEYLVEYTKDEEGNVTGYNVKADTLTYEDKIASRHSDNNWYHVQECEDCGEIVVGACYVHEHTANCVSTDICEVCAGLCSIIEPGKHTGTLEEIKGQAATCNAAGKKIYYKCSACKKSFFDAGAKQEITDMNDLVIPATGNHKIDKTATPTSNSDGTHKYTCTVCSTPVTQNCTGGEATCKAAATCEFCKTAYGSINPANHAMDTKELGRVEADGCKPGKTGQVVYECCPDIVVDEGTEIPAVADHSWVVSKPETNNCAEGYTVTKKCSYCGKTVEEAVPGGEHKLTKVVYETEKDCTKERNVYYACSECGFTDKQVTVNGVTYSYLSVTTIPAKGGCTWSDWTYEQKANCVVEGKRTRTCTECGKVATETVPKASHAIKTEKGVAPTCEASGVQDYAYCTTPNCPYGKGGQPIGSLSGYEKYKDSKGETIAALGHRDNNGDNYCDGCGRFEGSNSGSNECNCMCHKQNFIMKIFYKIASFFWKLFKIEKSCQCGAIHW